MEDETFYSVLTQIESQGFIFYSVENRKQREAEAAAALALQEDTSSVERPQTEDQTETDGSFDQIYLRCEKKLNHFIFHELQHQPVCVCLRVHESFTPH